jgi:hypothetical protein
LRNTGLHYYYADYYLGDKLKEGEMGGACGTGEGDEAAYKILVRLMKGEITRNT